MDYVGYIRQRLLEGSRKYWLVFDISERNPEQVDQLEAGILKGVRGISSSRRIITQFFQVARNACLVMDAAQVEAENTLSAISYNDPEALTASNMALLYRVWDKSPNDRFGPYGVFQNIAQYAVAAAKQLGLKNVAYTLDYYGYESRMADVFSKGSYSINSVADLANAVYATALAVDSRGKAEIAKEFTPAIAAQLTAAALQRVGSIYADEAEVAVNGDLHVPAGSTLMVSVPQQYMDVWNRRDALTPVDRFVNQYAIDHMHGLMPLVERLQRRYQVRIIDTKRYEQSRGRMFDREKQRR